MEKTHVLIKHWEPSGKNKANRNSRIGKASSLKVAG
jgi:hypothetical protein